MPDQYSGVLDWELEYRGLAEQEASNLRAFFEESEGRLETFVFADPAGNLLARSEEFNEAAWNRDPLLQAAAGFQDPHGTQRASRLTNQSLAVQGMRQAVALTGAYQYCFSLNVRHTTSGAITLRVRSASAANESTYPVTSTWRRVHLTAGLAVAEVPVWFELELPAGGIVDVFGLQAEAQIEPSPYKKTSSWGGVFPLARFDQDELFLMSDGPNQFSTKVRITSGFEG
ncbi:MAG: hypothetical protein FJW20_02445 [Acidimicrobiia bacterium]|nr:hypothetical protein [Acidimicrobiia bacterium]